MKVEKFMFNKLYKNNLEARGVKIQEDKEEKKDNKTAKKYRKRLSGKTISQIDQEFWDYLLELINNAGDYTQQEKNEIAEQSAEYYCTQTDYPIPNAMLTCLADFIMDETMTDKSVDKSSNTEYPVLSFRQLRKRALRQVAMETETLDYFNNRKHYNLATKRATSEKSENS